MSKPIGTIRQHKLTESEKRIWAKFMTPKYVYKIDEDEYINLKFIGYDKMEQEWRITPIKGENNDKL